MHTSHVPWKDMRILIQVTLNMFSKLTYSIFIKFVLRPKAA